MNLIAEIGGNHEGNQKIAIDYAKVAIDNGVKFIKYQLYSAESLVNPQIDPSRHEHFKKFTLNKDTFEEIANLCDKHSIEVISSSWDLSSLHFVDKFASRHKIGSGDFDNKYLISETLKLGKPVIMSCGLTDINRISDVINWIFANYPMYNNSNMLTLMHCTSVYPCPDNEINLRFIPILKSLFPSIDIGFSDHSIGLDALRICNLFGVSWVEKHFSLSRSSSTFRDHKCSIEPNEISLLNDMINKDNVLLGGSSGNLKPTLSEISSNHVNSFKRACYLRSDIKKGEIILKDNLVTLRPNVGISAWYYDDLIGKSVTCDINSMSPIFPHMVDDFNVG